MHNKKVYVFLYYLSLIISVVMCVFMFKSPVNYYGTFFGLISYNSFILTLINMILVIVFTILLMRRNLKDVNILLPITYILFMGMVLFICHLFNEKLIIPYIQYGYYVVFILINYLILNIYSILSIKKKSK